MDDIIKNKVTIVIPTYNSAKIINSTLSILTKYFKYIIVIDGQSKDLTKEICKKYDTKLFTLKNNNRGIQLNLGSEKVFTNWILFLHADSILENTAIEEIEKFISADENKYKAAAFKLKFDQVNIYAFLLSKVVTFRSKYFKLPYGDQGLLISKAFYNKIGGYKNLPIMEDVEIIRNIGFRNIKILNSSIITDSIRYQSAGWLIRPLINLYCLALYLLGFNIEIINKIYTRKKYGKN
jgi:rSAM/selenodomain-associated transferase 2